MPAPKLAGLTPFSSCDWPGQLAAVVFIAGCPWRCGYCHNADMQRRESPPHAPAWDEVLGWLSQRRGLLDGVVFSGGEALIEPQLPAMMAAVRELGFAVGLHTGGAYPARLEECLPLLDWVGFDIKAPFADYARVTQTRDSGDPAAESLQLLVASEVAFECRTTIHPGLLDDAALRQIGQTLQILGVQHYALQRFRRQGCQDDALNQAAIPASYPAAGTLAELGSRFSSFTLRQD